MRTFLLGIWVALMLLSIAARIISKRRTDSNFVAAVSMADLAFLFVGMLLVGLANVGSTNQFAKYQDGFPDVDMGSLPLEIFLGNLLIFALPLMIVTLTRIFWRKWKQDLKKIFSEPQQNQ